MDQTILAIQILTLLVVTIGGFFLKNYLPSYFGEKGKNLATREDIAAITEEIERIRTQYTADIERLRATLSYTTVEQTRLREQQKEALLKFYEECRSTIHAGAALIPRKTPDSEELAKRLNTFNEAVIQVVETSLRLGLYLPVNHQLYITATRVTAQIALLTLKTDQKLTPIIKTLSEPEQADQPPTVSAIDKFNREIEAELERLDDLLVQFIDEFNGYITTYEP